MGKIVDWMKGKNKMDNALNPEQEYYKKENERINNIIPQIQNDINQIMDRYNIVLSSEISFNTKGIMPILAPRPKPFVQSQTQIQPVSQNNGGVK